MVEIDTYLPGGAADVSAYPSGHGTAPHGCLVGGSASAERSGVILASDVGYRTSPGDAGGVVPYPPLMSAGMQINVQVNLDPADSALGAAWGTLTLANPDGQFNGIAATQNADGRAVKMLYGTKAFDPARQMYLDPAYASLGTAFAGVASPWFLSDTDLEVPLRDATYWLEQPLQSALYGGTGTYDGTADLAGKPIPKARGGTSEGPICNVTPVLIDPTNRIYQYTDGPGSVVNLYEGAALTIAFAGDTTDLYSGSTPAGEYRTDNSRGLFQLGGAPAHVITADVTGQFPDAGVQTTALAIARYLLTEDAEVPSQYVNTSAFAAADAAYPYAAGVYFDGSNAISGVDAVDSVLVGLGAKLTPARDGTLGVFVLRALAPTARGVLGISLDNTVSLTPSALPATLDPPPFRIQVGYSHNYTVQTSDINTATATAAQVQFIAASDRYAGASSGAILTAYRRPNNPAPVASALLDQADAQSVANDLLALWATRRRLYSAVVPAGIAIARSVGDIVNITFPMDDLSGGKLGQIVGYAFDTTTATATILVLV